MADQHPPMPALMPALSVRDPKATLDWFGKLGFQTLYTMPLPDGSIAHAHVMRNDVHFMLGPVCDRGVGAEGVEFYANLKDETVDALHARASAAGLTIGQAPQDQFWGDRTFEVVHPDGYRFMFAQHVRDVPAEEMEDAMKQMATAGAAS